VTEGGTRRVLRPRRPRLYLLERMPEYLVDAGRRGSPATFQKHPPVPRHDGAGKPSGGAAQLPDAIAFGASRCSACSACRPNAGGRERAAIEKARQWLDRIGPDRTGGRPRRRTLPYGRATPASRSRARHVHRSGAALVSMSPPPASTRARERRAPTTSCSPSARTTASRSC